MTKENKSAAQQYSEKLRERWKPTQKTKKLIKWGRRKGYLNNN